MQQFFRGFDAVPDCLVEKHIYAFGDEVEFLVEVDAVAGHDFDVDLVDEGGELYEKSQTFRESLFVLYGSRHQIDQSFVHQYLSVLLGPVEEVLLILFEESEGLFVLILLLLHSALQLLNTFNIIL